MLLDVTKKQVWFTMKEGNFLRHCASSSGYAVEKIPNNLSLEEAMEVTIKSLPSNRAADLLHFFESND